MADTTKRLTEGKPLPLIIGFSLPLLVGLIFQQMYSLVDAIIVGKTLGVDALAAVGSTGPVNFLILGFCIGISAGFAIPIAQRFGAEHYESMRRYVGNAVWLCGIISVILTTTVCMLCRWILTAMNTPQNIFEGAYSYIFIIFLGIPVTFLYNLTAGIMRSLGDSRTPVYFLLLASLLNIVLDVFFIIGVGTGVEGPALATVISQLISGLACLNFLRKHFAIVHLQKSDLRLTRHHAKNLLNMGIPMGLQYSITAIGAVVLQTAVNGLGSIPVAAMTASGKLNNFLVCPFDALGTTMATWCGQNLGAKKIDRAREGLKWAAFIGSVYSVLAFCVLRFTEKYMLLLFLNPDETEVIAMACQFLFYTSAFYIPLCCVNVFRFAIQGLGFSYFAIIAGVLEMIARVIAGVVLIPLLGYVGACWASPIAWILADAFLIPAFYWVCNKVEQRLDAAPL